MKASTPPEAAAVQLLVRCGVCGLVRVFSSEISRSAVVRRRFDCWPSLSVGVVGRMRHLGGYLSTQYHSSDHPPIEGSTRLNITAHQLMRQLWVIKPLLCVTVLRRLVAASPRRLVRPTPTQRKKRTKGSSAATLAPESGADNSVSAEHHPHRRTVVHCCSCCHRPVEGAGRCLHYQISER